MSESDMDSNPTTPQTVKLTPKFPDLMPHRIHGACQPRRTCPLRLTAGRSVCETASQNSLRNAPSEAAWARPGSRPRKA